MAKNALPQFLAPGETAPADAPQTQFVLDPSAQPEEIYQVATQAMTYYADAEAAGRHPIPPAGVYVGPQVEWTAAADVPPPAPAALPDPLS